MVAETVQKNMGLTQRPDLEDLKNEQDIVNALAQLKKQS
jgi:hypothetical protein